MNFILWVTLSGVILSLSHSAPNFFFLAWVGLVPLFFALDGKNRKSAFLYSYVCGLIFFLSSMCWLVYVTPTGWILLSLYQALYFAAFGLCFSIVLSTLNFQLSIYILLPSIWALLEYLRSNIGGGIGWNLLGYSQYKNLPVIQIADITGVYGISFLIMLVNLTVFCGIKMVIDCCRNCPRFFMKSKKPLREEIRSHPFWQSVGALLVFVLVLSYGYKRIEYFSRLEASAKDLLKVSVIQGNIPQPQKWDKYYEGSILEKYRMLTAKAAKEKPHIIIWPETSIPGYPNEDRSLLSKVGDIAKDAGTFLLAGAPMAAYENDKAKGDYNSAILFSGNGKFLQQHNKIHLVAFGEFIPFERYLPFLRRFLPLAGDFVSGSEYTLFKLKTPKPTSQFGVLVCFEDIFPEMVSRLVREGADFMVNITNDAWFGKTCAAYQHAANSVFRAIENRRPFVRSANTGLSCFMDRAGKIYGKVSSKGSDLFVEGYKTDIIRITPNMPFTFYTRHGDAFILFCSFITAFFVIDYIRRQRYNK